MHRFLSLIPWMIGIVWTLSTNNLIITGLLGFGLCWQLFEIRKYHDDSRRILVHSIVQFGWIAAALVAIKPLIFLGLFIQSLSYKYYEHAFATEKKRFRVKLGNYEQQIDLLYELRKQRHDLQMHAAALTYSNDVKGYRDELSSRHVDIDKMLKNESNIVAGALFSHREQARKKCIELEYNFQQAISGLPLSDYEFISFIGNILQNALEASIEYMAESGEQSKIIFSCRKQSGIWIVVCQNQTVPIKNEIIKRMYTKRAKTTKGGAHEGIGTQQIAQIAKKYSGSLDFSVIKNQFTLKIKIPDVK